MANAQGQSLAKGHRKIPSVEKPMCSPRAICFTGRVERGKEFRKELNSELEFVLEPGWTIAVMPKRPVGECTELASVVNAPYRAHRALDIDATYEWTAEMEAGYGAREFRFVTNCADYKIESERLSTVLWGYTSTQQQYDEAMAKLGSLARGKGRLWMTDSRISHSEDTAEDKKGFFEWMAFTVEILLPAK